MRFVPTFFHGIADYIVGLLVLALPFLIAVVDPAARTTIMAVGILVLLYSAMTDYELGLIRFFRIRFHLLLNGIFGLSLSTSRSAVAGLSTFSVSWPSAWWQPQKSAPKVRRRKS